MGIFFCYALKKQYILTASGGFNPHDFEQLYLVQL